MFVADLRNILTSLLLVTLGLGLLTVAADRLVVSAARLSRAWGLGSILIGALVLGVGTSLPEMLVSGLAAAEPNGLDLAIGNVVGSNVANLAMVLGLSALIAPMSGQLPIIRREGLTMLVASTGFAVLVWDGALTRVDGLLLLAGLVAALTLIIRWARSAPSDELRVSGEVDGMLGESPIRVGRELLLAVVSLGATLVGARLLLTGAEGVGRDLGISEAVIGLTLVAVGTSLPELATALAASRRGENDLVLGNVLGSNLFNVLAVGGVAGVIGGGPIAADFSWPLGLMIGVAVVAGLLAATSDELTRWEAGILVATYPALVTFGL